MRPQEVLSTGGAIFHSVAVGDKDVKEKLSRYLSRSELMFPQTASYKNYFSSLVDVLVRVQRSEEKISAATTPSNEGWFACSLVKLGHALDGTFSAHENPPRQSITSFWMFGGRGFPPVRLIKTCGLQGLLAVVGLRGSMLPELAKLHTTPSGEAVIGAELQCALDLLYHPAISDGMSRTEALAVLSKYKNEGISCE